MGTKEPLWSRLMVAWGRKRASEDQPAPPLPAGRTRSPQIKTTHHLDTNKDHIPYPNYYVYDTQEQSLKRTAFRDRQKNIPPPPLP